LDVRVEAMLLAGTLLVNARLLSGNSMLTRPHPVWGLCLLFGAATLRG
jgi:hypothetical protein